MKTKDQIQKEAADRRRREDRERLQIQREVIAGERYPSGERKTEEQRMRDLHPDDYR